LNHGAFGAFPTSVRRRWHELQDDLTAYPDNWFFSGKLQARLAEAARACAPFLGAAPDEVCLMENATVAQTAISRRWAKMATSEDHVLVLSVAYGPVVSNLNEAMGRKTVVAEVPFPCPGPHAVLQCLEDCLKAHRGKVRFAVLDHISSQPALLLPIREMVLLCRQYGVEEVAVDGAHSLGSVPFNVEDIGADWFWTNLHKWGFAPPVVTVVHGRRDLMNATHHPIVSWNYGQGLASECLFTGSRDYSAMLSVPCALEFLSTWRDEEGRTSQEHCHQRVLEAAALLSDAWGTELQPSSLVATQAMVQMPFDLDVSDIPGVPGQGVRSTLRERFKIEAAIGSFGERGNFVRLSYAIYNTHEDIARLRDAVLLLRDEGQVD